MYTTAFAFSTIFCFIFWITTEITINYTISCFCAECNCKKIVHFKTKSRNKSKITTRRTQKIINTLTKIKINGFDVYIGKNNKQNDYIISKLSKDEDYWFHTRLCAGSHVLLKVNEKEPDEETIFECCKLARENSASKQPSKVGVIYTKRKFIKKPPAAPLGYVIYKNEKEILV